jgi:hypothetical protein
MAKRGIELEGTKAKKAKKVGLTREEIKTIKFREYCNNVFKKRMSEYDAAIAAGYSKSVARNTKDKIWKQKQAKDVLAEITQLAVNPQDIMRNFQLGLNAMKVQFVGKEGRPEQTIDMSTRLETMKLLRRYLNIEDDQVNVNVPLTINFVKSKI